MIPCVILPQVFLHMLKYSWAHILYHGPAQPAARGQHVALLKRDFIYILTWVYHGCLVSPHVPTDKNLKDWGQQVVVVYVSSCLRPYIDIDIVLYFGVGKSPLMFAEAF
jgi:hypothetical protein